MKTKFVEFGGERFEVPAGKSPRSIADAQRMQRALRAAEKPAEAPSRSSATPTPKRASRAPSASPRPSKRQSQPKNSQQVAGDPRTSDGYNRIGASAPPTQDRTRRLPSTPTGSGVTRTAGSQADRSPSRAQSPRPQTPDRDSRPRSTTKTNTRPPVKAGEITTLAQWKALTREQRRNTPGVPNTMLDAIRKYGLGS
jgi:hypothetical protein